MTEEGSFVTARDCHLIARSLGSIRITRWGALCFQELPSLPLVRIHGHMLCLGEASRGRNLRGAGEGQAAQTQDPLGMRALRGQDFGSPMGNACIRKIILGKPDTLRAALDHTSHSFFLKSTSDVDWIHRNPCFVAYSHH